MQSLLPCNLYLQEMSRISFASFGNHVVLHVVYFQVAFPQATYHHVATVEPARAVTVQIKFTPSSELCKQGAKSFIEDGLHKREGPQSTTPNYI